MWKQTAVVEGVGWKCVAVRRQVRLAGWTIVGSASYIHARHQALRVVESRLLTCLPQRPKGCSLAEDLLCWRSDFGEEEFT